MGSRRCGGRRRRRGPCGEELDEIGSAGKARGWYADLLEVCVEGFGQVAVDGGAADAKLGGDLRDRVSALAVFIGLVIHLGARLI